MATDQVISGEETLESMNSAAWYNKWLLNKFKKNLHGDILEVGCGIGNFTKLLENYGKVYAGDIEKKYIDLTKSSVSPTTEVGKVDIEKASYFFKEKKFDSIVCLNVLEHIKDDEKAIQNLNKLLKPKGYLFLIVPSNPKLYGTIDKAIDHFRRYDKSKLKIQLEHHNFKIIKIKRLNMLGGIGWYLAGKVFKDKKVSKGRIKVFNIVGPVYLHLFERFFEPRIGTSVLAIARKR